MRRIIFLDIDGVIAVPTCLSFGMWALSDEKQELLQQLLSKTGAEIVISSSWRKNNLQDTKDHMRDEGFWAHEKITGHTIRAYHYLERNTGIHLSLPRGVEIKQWIDTNIHSENGKHWNRKFLGKDYQYLILDDDSDMLLEHKNNFIRTNGVVGLTEQNVLDGIEILNKRE